jgi:hypothetical protein
MGTEYHLADCYEHIGRTATAYILFLEVAAAARQSAQIAREQVARERATALEPKVSKLRIVAPRNVQGMEVRKNGALLGGMLWDRPVPTDPGTYTIDVSAPGMRTWSIVTVVAADGALVTVKVPLLDARSAGGHPTPPASAAANTQDASANGASAQRTLAYAVGAGAVIGVAIGTFFGLQSIARHGDYAAHCIDNRCDATGFSLHDTAVTDGNLSTFAFVAGAAAAAGAAVLYFTAPEPSTAGGGPRAQGAKSALRAAPVVSATGGGLSLTGAFE